jgi:hypothetical protein
LLIIISEDLYTDEAPEIDTDEASEVNAEASDNELDFESGVSNN